MKRMPVLHITHYRL